METDEKPLSAEFGGARRESETRFPFVCLTCAGRVRACVWWGLQRGMGTTIVMGWMDGMCCVALRCCRSSLLVDNLQVELLLFLLLLLLLSGFLFITIADY